MKKIKDIIAFCYCFSKPIAIVILALLAIIIGIVENIFVMTLIGMMLLEILILPFINTNVILKVMAMIIIVCVFGCYSIINI